MTVLLTSTAGGLFSDDKLEEVGEKKKSRGLFDD